MNSFPFEYWIIAGGLILLGLLTFAGMCYFFPCNIHKPKFKE